MPRQTTLFAGILIRIKRDYSIKGLLVAALAALLLSGCGGEAGDSSSERGGLTYSVEADTTVTTGTFSEDEVFARAKKMCKNRQTLIRNLFELYREQHPRAAGAKLIAGASYSLILPGIEFMFDDLYMTGGPEGDEDAAAEIEEMIGAMQYAIETGEKKYPASAQRIGYLFRNFNRLARANGFDQCTVDRSHYAEIWEASEKG